jgi:hypothetical protein
MENAMRLRVSWWLLAVTLLPSCEWNGDGIDPRVTAATIDAGATYSLVGVESGRCIQIENGSLSRGAPAELGNCRPAAAQQFRLEPSSQAAGYYRIRNLESGLCLDVEGVSIANGARIIQWSCGAGENQLWTFVDVAGGALRIAARHSGKVLDVPGHAIADGTHLQQWSYANQANQHFTLRPGAGAPGADAGVAADAGPAGPPGDGRCAMTAARLRTTEVDVGAPMVADSGSGRAPIAISPLSSGGARLAWSGTDGRVHVAQLDASDHLGGTALSLPAHDFQDLLADEGGGVVLLTREATGGGILGCGQPTNLCGTPPAPPVPCFDTYLVRFDGTAESWARKLTSSSATLPPYSTGPTGPNVFFTWWYDHQGRIVTDGTRYATYFGSAISVSQGGCINIHQGDRAVVVSRAGQVVGGGFDWGCSHSGYERVAWDGSSFTYVCKNDAPTAGKSGKVALAPSISPIVPVDLWYSDLGDVVPAAAGSYWAALSDRRAGQPASAAGLADVHLVHFGQGAADRNLILASDPGLNDRGPHLASYGARRMLAAWETSSRAGELVAGDGSRRLFVQTLDRTTGAAEGAPLQVGVVGNPYQELVAFPDGSVAYAARGSTSARVKILRVLPCE